jgi:hypothetical protein
MSTIVSVKEDFLATKIQDHSLRTYLKSEETEGPDSKPAVQAVEVINGWRALIVEPEGRRDPNRSDDKRHQLNGQVHRFLELV